jgi:hypothetical protein
MDEVKNEVETKDVVEQETLLPSEERYLNVFVNRICADIYQERLSEKVVSEKGEKDICDLQHLPHLKKAS